MQLLVILTAIVIVFSVYFYFGQIEKPIEIPEPQDEVGQVKIEAERTSKKTEGPEKKEPEILVDTQITSGPEEGEIIDKTNQVTFEFKGKIIPENTEGTVYFETKVEELDKDWKGVSGNKITIDFPAGSKEYTFLVRAKFKDFVDPTPAKRNFKVSLSPYFGKIKINNISSASITLTSNLTDDEKIDITNWRIEGSKGTIIVPQGTQLFLPANPSQSDIFVEKYDTVYLLSEQSPFLTSRSFKPNKCFGYLTSYYGSGFPFSFSKICPQIDCEQISHFSETCQSFIMSLQSCNAREYSQESQVSFDSACQTFIENYIARNLSYEGCIENYYRDKDFFQSAWYVYVGYNIFCKCVDTLYLYDRDGFLVDKYFYQS